MRSLFCLIITKFPDIKKSFSEGTTIQTKLRQTGQYRVLSMCVLSVYF